MIGRALTLACCLGALASAADVVGATNASGAKEELRELKARIEGIQQKLTEAEESKSDAADALKKSEGAISDANRALSDLSERSRGANSKLAQLKREIERGQIEVKAHQASLEKLLYAQYAAGRPETLGILLNGGDPNAIARRLHYLTYIGRARSETIGRVRQDLARLEQLAADAQSQAKELSAITAQQTAQRQRLEQEKRARAQVLTHISQAIEQQRRQIGTLKRDETRLARLIEQLSRAIAKAPKPRPVPERRAKPDPQIAPEARVHIERVPEAGMTNGAFGQLRGRLALPVRGELANRFGSPRQDGGVVWKGLFIAARSGEEVRAVAAGRVVYADWLRGFGNLLIIDHGDSYMSLYGYNETLFKQVGDVIRGGDKVAAVGNTGGHPDSGLYFELRHEGRPFDPMTWVSVR
ncbi:MAG TPA: peptidoglycan DD-metalloendopeptidase family protein [Burkholderiales bacterium]|nr:peptidoglycan DD-metalloendopeptidase family protein [Burkholderiales bacterium]